MNLVFSQTIFSRAFFVWVIGILVIRICFAFRYSDFGFNIVLFVIYSRQKNFYGQKNTNCIAKNYIGLFYRKLKRLLSVFSHICIKNQAFSALLATKSANLFTQVTLSCGVTYDCCFACGRVAFFIS